MLSLWYFIPTGAFLVPVAISVLDEQVTFARKTPYGTVWAWWWTELRSERGQCHAPPVPHLVPYDSEGADVDGVKIVTYPLPVDLRPCVGIGEPFIMEIRHRALIVDTIPLRPLVTRWACFSDGTPCVRL